MTTMRMLRRGLAPVAALAALALGAGAARALEVDEVSEPRVTVDAEFIGTLDYTRPSGDGTRESIEPNTDDSGVLFAFDKHLYTSPVAVGAAVRLRLEDREAEPHVLVFLTGPRYRLTLGDFRLQNSLVRFPTVREEDLLDYTHIQNAALGPLSSGDQLFGRNLLAEWFLRPSAWRVGAFAETRTHTDNATRAETDARRPDTFGALLVYDVPESLRYEHALRRAGLIAESQRQQRRDGEAAARTSVLVGGLLGLNDHPEYPWELGFQAIRSESLEDRDAAGDPVRATSSDELGREAATAVVVSLHYADRHYLQTRWQAGLTLAQKTYDDLDSATQQSIVPALFWRISSGTDFVVQAAYTAYHGDLETFYGRSSEWKAQIGISMGFEAVLNDQVVDYGSILELEHGSRFRSP